MIALLCDFKYFILSKNEIGIRCVYSKPVFIGYFMSGDSFSNISHKRTTTATKKHYKTHLIKSKGT